MSSDRWYGVRTWREEQRDDAARQIERAELRRIVPAPPIPTKRVRAVSATWCVGGRPVTPGEAYALAADTAEGLVHVGKAEWA